jgi:tricorn protease
MRITEVLSGGPVDTPDSFVTPGAIITALDGRPIPANQGIHHLLNRRAGLPALLSVQPAGGGEIVTQTVTPASMARETALAYRRWVESRRALVEEMSAGRIGYLHISGMNLPSYQHVYSELFGRYRQTEAVLVDIRSNGGGNLHDQLITLLTGSHDSSLVSRHGVEVVRNPVGRYTGQSAVLVNASSYSDASIFPTLYQKKGIGAIIGEHVPGTGTAVVDDPQLEPRLTYRIPELGFRLKDGTWFENFEVVPDIPVYNDPESIAEGQDLQLERAVIHLMGVIGAESDQAIPPSAD